jgi:folate-binding protein YgfZ
MTLPLDYRAALEGAVFYPIAKAGYLRLAGPDRRSFVQRQVTNNINLLSTGHAQTSVLTSPLGRILDVLVVFAEGIGEAETLNLIPLPGRAADTLRYFKSRIFIMDKVNIVDESQSYAHYLLEGPHSASVLGQLSLPPAPEADTLHKTVLEGYPLTLIGPVGFQRGTCSLLIPQAGAPLLEAALQQAGAVRLSAGIYDLLRIEAGLPADDHELNESYTPLEVGLSRFVAENKGCYTGQEVLARQVTYDKVTRQLCGVRLSAPIAPGREIFTDGHAVGTVTSSALSPRFGSIALAVLKRPFFEAGTSLITGEKDQPVNGITCTLPFSNT